MNKDSRTICHIIQKIPRPLNIDYFKPLKGFEFKLYYNFAKDTTPLVFEILDGLYIFMPMYY